MLTDDASKLLQQLDNGETGCAVHVPVHIQ
jgi:hypothetical protein